MNERDTIPPNVDGSLKFTVRTEVLVPLGDELSIAFPDEGQPIYEAQVTTYEQFLEPPFPIDASDPNDPGTLLAWHFIMSVFDPFQGECPETRVDTQVDCVWAAVAA